MHQFKFIVDGVWRFSKKLLTCNDGKGNTNNIIDTNNTKDEKGEDHITSTTLPTEVNESFLITGIIDNN